MKTTYTQASDQSWVTQAVCRYFPSQWWFPERTADIPNSIRAVAVCKQCPVQMECLEWSLENDDRYGIFGGLHPEQRYELKHNRPLRKDSRWLR